VFLPQFRRIISLGKNRHYSPQKKRSSDSIDWLSFFRKLNSRCVCAAESLFIFWRKHKLWWGHISNECVTCWTCGVCGVCCSVCVSTGIWPKASRVSCLGLLHNLRLTTYSLLPHTSNLISADLFKLGTCRYAIIISCGMERGGGEFRQQKWRVWNDTCAFLKYCCNLLSEYKLSNHPVIETIDCM
jgi:hypothetical protein